MVAPTKTFTTADLTDGKWFIVTASGLEYEVYIDDGGVWNDDVNDPGYFHSHMNLSGASRM